MTASTRTRSTTHPILSLLAVLARGYPWPVDPGEELQQAIDFLERPVTASTIVRAGYVVGTGIGLVVAIMALLVPAKFRLPVGLAALSSGLLATHLVHRAPALWASAKRTSALGATPDLVARTVLSMRLAPSPERAAEFAANTGTGVLATSLGKHVRQGTHTAQSGLETFGDAWSDLFPSLRRSCDLVTAAGNAPAGDRERLLDRSLQTVMEGTRDQMQSFAARIRTPVTALYAFGVLLPTALVALLPAASAAGVAVTPLSVLVVYNIVLPGVLIAAGGWLLTRRPVAFPPPAVSSDHPDVSDHRRRAQIIGAVGALIAWLVASHLLPVWGAPIAALGVGTGLVLWVRFRSIVGIYDRIRAVEDSLPDALSLIGRRVANGRAVETAIEETATELDGETGTVLEAGARRQRQLQLGIQEAFLGRNGTLDRVPSPRVRGSFALLSLAAEEGRPAGSALLSLASHVQDLQDIEREARHSLAHICRTLQTTGTVFAPMVAGSTVALAEGIGGEAALGGGGQSLVWLGAPVGLYVLVLAVVLTALATGLTRGLDQTLVGYRSGRALVCATVVYGCAYLVVGPLV